MKLTTRIFKTFTIIFVIQIVAVCLWAFILYSDRENEFPEKIASNLINVERSVLEGVILQNKLGNYLTRDLISYRLLELNNLDTVEFLPALPFEDLRINRDLHNCTLRKDIYLCFRSNRQYVMSLIPLKFNGVLQGYLKLEKSLKLAEEFDRKILFTTGLTLAVVFMMNAVALLFLWWKFLKPETTRLIKAIENEEEDFGIRTEEYKKVQRSFLDAVQRVKTAELEKRSLESQLEKMNLAVQVAHDIRSPLEVLKSLKGELSSFPVNVRNLIQLSINRMEEITFNLLKEHRDLNTFTDSSTIQSEELLSLLELVLLEKRTEYSKVASVQLIGDFDSTSYGLFSKINRGAFKSIISNIINNAVEAFEGRGGKVSLRLKQVACWNVVEVRDNGPGIPRQISESIFKKGFTTKQNGNGIGLSSAFNEVSNLGGKIEYESELGETVFRVFLPQSEATPNFLKVIDVGKYNRIIILDDDLAFHNIWKKKLEFVPLIIESFYSVSDLIETYDNLPASSLLLCDYELGDAELDGVDVILKYRHAENSILITSKSEEVSIREKCRVEKIPFLPKAVISYVEVISSAAFIILIDDDKLIRIGWENYFRKKGVPFKAYPSIDAFLLESHHIQKDAKIYIDCNLGETRGEVESEKIYSRGFTNLYLATGYDEINVDKPNWIKNIYSKDPRKVY